MGEHVPYPTRGEPCADKSCGRSAWTECPDGFCLFHSPENGSDEEMSRLVWQIARRMAADETTEVADYSRWHFPEDPDSHLASAGDEEETRDIGCFAGTEFICGAHFCGASFSADVLFSGASFSGDAWFAGASFSGDADFSGASFSGDAWFAGASFSGNADFSDASFSGFAWFSNTSFSGHAWFSNASFSGDARFGNASFSEDAWFSNASFSGEANFSDASFSGAALFSNASFSGAAWFFDASFSGHAWFDDVSFSGDAWFSDASFSEHAWFDDVSFSGEVSFFTAVCAPGAMVHLDDPFRIHGFINKQRRHPFLRTLHVLLKAAWRDLVACTSTGRRAVRAVIYAVMRWPAFLAGRPRPFRFRRAGETAYRFAKQAAQQAGDYTVAGRYHYAEQCAIEDKLFYESKPRPWCRKSWLWLGRLIFGRIVFGYGERPLHPLLLGLTVIVVWTALYVGVAAIAPGIETDPAAFAAYRPSLGEAVHFSVVTFTTLGYYGDFQPKAPYRWLADTEAVLGACLMAVFVVCLTRKYMR